jgi:CMP-N-acetylneuraminic acid synthetase
MSVFSENTTNNLFLFFLFLTSVYQNNKNIYLKQSQKQIKTQCQIKKPNSAFPTQKSEHNIDGKSCKTSKTG